MYFRYPLVGLCCLVALPVWAQSSLQLSLEGQFNGAPGLFLPHYHYAQQGGRFGTDNIYGLVELGGRYAHRFDSSWQLGAVLRVYAQNGKAFVQEGFLSVRWRTIRLSAGRLQETGTDLSIGDLGQSNNAAPIPKIGINIDYTPIPIPYVRDWLALQGAWYHGQLGENRHIRNPYWHHKELGIRVGTQGWYVFGKLRHYAIWGGTDAQGVPIYAPSLENFWQVFTAQPIDREDPLNAGGSHIAIYELSVTLPLGKVHVTLYGHRIAEYRRLLPPVPDGVLGTSIKLPWAWLSQIDYTFLSTTEQEGVGLPDRTAEYPTIASNFGHTFGGRSDTYNNYFYQSGYTHLGYGLGNALLLTRGRAQNIGLLDLETYRGEAFVNNRVQAHHFYIKLKPHSRLDLGIRLTYTRNLGSYSGLYEGRTQWQGIQRDPNFSYTFLPAKHQWYSQVALSYYFEPLPVALFGSFALDIGALYTQWGVMLGARYVWDWTY